MNTAQFNMIKIPGASSPLWRRWTVWKLQTLRAISAAMLCVLVLSPCAVNAQNNTVPLTTTPLLTVLPLVGVVAQPRTLTVTGQWPITCAPVAATLDASLIPAAKTVTIRLQAPLTTVACAQALTPYRFDLAYTAREVGVVRVLMVSSTGAPSGEGRIVTTVPGVVRSAGNISGAWYDPLTNGSGLSFIHAYQGSDVVFGTWYLYDNNGLSRWFSIQDVTWNEGGTVMEGKLYETRAGADVCPQTVVACPATSTSLTTVGRMRATFIGIGLLSDTAPQARIEAFSNSNVLLFSSNIARAI